MKKAIIDHETIIYKYTCDIDTLNKKKHKVCGEHDFETFKEPYMYGEKYQVCKKCGFCR